MKARQEIAVTHGPILRSVSRSFYLSIRILPASVREPIALAYLLARASDTIADLPGIDREHRETLLRGLADAIQDPAPSARMRQFEIPLVSADPGERALMVELPRVLHWLNSLGELDRREVRAVLQKINKGQLIDVARFPGGGEIAALSSAADLDEYTYLVAGSVGAFWTRVCTAHIRDFCARPASEMLELGMRYGRGLQLVNILRDAATDLCNGRCYLPADELLSLGMSATELLDHPERALPVIQDWRERAERAMQAGVEYACAIRSARLRFAVALPALIGARTLALLRTAGATAFVERVKVPRPEVRAIVWSVTSRLVSPQSLRDTLRRLSR